MYVNISQTLSLTNAKVSTVSYSQKNQIPAGAMKHYGRRMKLHCEHHYNLLIFGNQTVTTSDDDIDKHCIMEFTSVAVGHVRIRGVEANLFLAMNKDGLLYGEVDISYYCVFLKLIIHNFF